MMVAFVLGRRSWKQEEIVLCRLEGPARAVASDLALVVGQLLALIHI